MIFVSSRHLNLFVLRTVIHYFLLHSILVKYANNLLSTSPERVNFLFLVVVTAIWRVLSIERGIVTNTIGYLDGVFNPSNVYIHLVQISTMYPCD